MDYMRGWWDGWSNGGPDTNMWVGALVVVTVAVVVGVVITRLARK